MTTKPLDSVLPLRKRAEVIHRVLTGRLDTILPNAMRENGLDMWILLCQEDDIDPLFRTMMPMDTWFPILQMLVLTDQGETAGIERTSIAMTDTRGLHRQPWRGFDSAEQWELLGQLVEARDPKRIGINTGRVQWAAGGLTHNLYAQLVEALPRKYAERLESAEGAAIRWAATLSGEEIRLFEHVVDVAKGLIAECYSRDTIVPGQTTLDDLTWHYWQRVADLGLALAFKPYFFLIRNSALTAEHGPTDRVIRHGDFVRCDVGIKYLRLNSDHQQWAYVLRPGETEAPEGMQRLFGEVHRLQDVFLEAFREGLTGNELLASILAEARAHDIPEPKVYSHSLGLFLHEPGPLIGLPWEQTACPGRGDVALFRDSAFTMEVSVTSEVPDWTREPVRMSVEEDVVFTAEGCHVIGRRQDRFHLV